MDNDAQNGQAATTEVNRDKLKADVDKFLKSKKVKDTVAGIEGFELASHETWTETQFEEIYRFSREVLPDYGNGSGTIQVNGEPVKLNDMVDTFVSEAKQRGYIVISVPTTRGICRKNGEHVGLRRPRVYTR